jgi:hypothetical protein
VDAELRQSAADDGTAAAAAGVQLQYFLNGELAYSRQWPTRALALEEAARKRAELERDGWMFHW